VKFLKLHDDIATHPQVLLYTSCLWCVL